MVFLHWELPAEVGMSRVRVYRSTNPGSLGRRTRSQVGQEGSLQDRGLRNGRQYYYTIRRVDPSGRETTIGRIAVRPDRAHPTLQELLRGQR